MKNMEQELFNLVYQASLDKKMIYYKDLRSIISNGLDLDDFISKITVRTLNNKYQNKPTAEYNLIEKKIILYKKELFMLFQKYYNKSDSLDSFSRYFYSNIHILKVVLHESFHAGQFKTLNEIRTNKKNNLNLEDLIIFTYYEMFDKLFDQNCNMHLMEILFNYYKYMDLAILFDKNRKINPMETMADINANIISYDILNMSEKISDARKCYEDDFLSDIISLYQRSPYPTLDFFRKMNREDLLEFLPFYSSDREEMIINMFANYDLSTRIAYGLAVSSQELKQLVKAKKQ